MGSAYMRAEHLRLDPPPWIVEDVLARSMLSDRYIAAADAAFGSVAPDVCGAFRAHFAIRARLAEDAAVDGLAAARRDYVILGAGADTFALRHPRSANFTIWEIDHPASQTWKRAAIERLNLETPTNLRFVPADLAATSLRDLELPSSATWNWLGVTQYLEKSATDATLQAIAATGPGTTAVVEFLLTEGHCDELGFAFRSQSIMIGEQSGEPMISFYEPSEVDELFGRSGFTDVQLLDTHALTQRYIPPGSQLRFPGAATFAIATN